MKLTAFNDETGKLAVVIPVALQDISGYVKYSALALFGLITGSPIQRCRFNRWHLLPAENGYDIGDAEVVTDIYGEDEPEWRAAADTKLSDWGLRLGEFVPRFAFRVGDSRFPMVADRRYDGYLLEAAR